MGGIFDSLSNRDFGLEPGTIDNFRKLLQAFSRDKLVYLCGAINLVLHCWRGAPDFERQAELLPIFFGANQIEQIRQLSVAGRISRVVFHRQQLLFVAKEAILHCPADGLDPMEEHDLVGPLFLIANSHLERQLPSFSDKRQEELNLITNFILGTECGEHLFRNAMTRACLLYKELAEQLRTESAYINIVERFETFSGLKIDQFFGLCLSLFLSFSKVTVKQFVRNPGGLIFRLRFFEDARVPKDRVQQFLKRVSATPDEFKAIPSKGLHDFTMFRAHPLYCTADGYFCVDPGLLAEKIESEPFWLVHSTLPSNSAKVSFHSFWGKVFERYMNWMFSECIGKDNRWNVLNENPRYERSGEEVCDAIVVSGASALFIEYKGATFSAEGKYSGQPSVLGAEIERKLLHSERGRRKGVEQLADAISRTCRKKAPEKIVGIDMSGIRKAYPILITRDAIGDVFFMHSYLNFAFRDKLCRKKIRCTVTPLFCMSVQTAEGIGAYLREAAFDDIVDGRYRGKQAGKDASFFTWENPVLQQIGDRENLALKCAFQRFSLSMRRAVFGIQERQQTDDERTEENAL